MEPNPTRTMGKGMLIVAWIIVLVGLTLVFGQWEKHRLNPNQSLNVTGQGEVVLQQNRYNHYVANGTINQQTVVFMLDTGATDVVVPAKLAAKLGLKQGHRGKAMTANGIVTVYDTVIDTLALGPIQLFDVRASINPAMHGQEILLGMSALKDLELIQKGASLTIRHPR